MIMTVYSFKSFAKDLDRVSDLYYNGQTKDAEALLQEIDQKISSTYKKREFWQHFRDCAASAITCNRSGLMQILTDSKEKFSNLLVYRCIKHLTETYFSDTYSKFYHKASPNPHRFFIHWDFERDGVFDVIFQREVRDQVKRAISLKVDRAWELAWEPVATYPRTAMAVTAAALCWPGFTATVALTATAAGAAYGIYKVYQNLGSETRPPSPQPFTPPRVPVPGLRHRVRRTPPLT